MNIFVNNHHSSKLHVSDLFRDYANHPCLFLRERWIAIVLHRLDSRLVVDPRSFETIPILCQWISVIIAFHYSVIQKNISPSTTESESE